MVMLMQRFTQMVAQIIKGIFCHFAELISQIGASIVDMNRFTEVTEHPFFF